MKQEFEIDTSGHNRLTLTVEQGDPRPPDSDPNPNPNPNPDPDPVPESDFVQVADGRFAHNGQPLRLGGTNAYYLPTYENIDPAFCTRTWDMFAAAGVNLVRVWGFYDGPAQYSGDPTFQTFRNRRGTVTAEYHENGLRCLDRTIAQAKDRGMFVVPALINYWEQLGGVLAYMQAVGGIGDSMSGFINNETCQRLFREYIEMLLNRVNTETGVAYKDEPAILGWNICNEARNPGRNPAELRDWYQAMAAYIKSIDPNHLVSTGEEGYDDESLGSWGSNGFEHPHYSSGQYSNTYVLRAAEGTSYVMNTAIPEIDFGWFHWYPGDWGWWGVNPQAVRTPQTAWLKDHKTIAAQAGKPVVCGEYGFYTDWLPEPVLYHHFWQAAEQEGIDATLLWQLVSNGPKINEFGGNIGPTRGGGLYNDITRHFTALKQQT